MRKTNSLKAFFTMCLLCVVGTLGAWAQTTVTFVAKTDKGEETCLTKDGITLTLEKGSSTLTGSLNNGTDYRIYKNNDLTISSANGNITRIVFTCTANNTVKYGPGCLTTPNKNEYTYKDKIGTWKGDASSVKFTAETAQVRATKIEVTYAAEGTVLSPSISVSSKDFDEPFDVTLSSAKGTNIYYTLDGNNPTTNSTKYDENPIRIPATTTTLKAIAEKDGKTSKVAEATYTFKVEKPEIEVVSKTFTDPFETKITATTGAVIYYTLDGNDPTIDSEKYTKPIQISKTTTLKAIAVKYGQTSEVAEAIYTYSETKVGDGTFENPYSPEEVLAKSDELQGKEVWVKGNILGSANKKEPGYASITSNSTNIAIGESGLDKSIAIYLGEVGSALRNYFTKDNKSTDIVEKNFIFYGKCSKNTTYLGRSIGIANCYAFAGTETDPVATLEVKTDEGYATFVSKYPFYVPEGVECGVITDANNTTLNINYKYKEGFGTSNIVPANYPVLVKTNCGKKTYNLVIGGNRKGSSTETNLLQAGTGKVFTADANHLYYKLAYDNFNARTDLGFYWGAADGGAFFVPEGSAYLAVPKSVAASVKSFRLEDATTGITAPIAAEGQTVKTVYTIDGRRVQNADHLPKGLYIVNGKKVMIK